MSPGGACMVKSLWGDSKGADRFAPAGRTDDALTNHSPEQNADGFVRFG